MTRTFKVASLLAFTSITRGNIGVVLLTIFILALVALNLLFVPSLLRGLIVGANNKVINTYAGDIVIEPGGDNTFIKDVDHLIAKIRSIDGVVGVAPRNSLGAEIDFENERTNCIIYGIRPEEEKKVFHIYNSLLEGSYLDSKDRDEILLGIQLAGADRPQIELYSRSLRSVHAGDKVTVTYANGLEKRYRVKGVFYTEFIQTDLQAFVPEKEFETIMPLGRNRASTIHVKIADDADIEDIVEQLKYLRDDLKILTWQDYAGIIRSMTDSFNVINAILNLVNLLVAGITVFIVTYIDVSNRRRQIGIQRAIGIIPQSITLAYLMRAIFYAIIGAILASLVFTYIVVPLEAKYPFHFPFGSVYLVIGFPHIVRTALVLLIVSIVATLIPVERVMRLKILDAIWS